MNDLNDDMREAASAAVDETPPLPDGEYAIVELMGHTTMIGRVSEVDRFGTKLLSIEPIFQGQLLAAVLQGGPSIYRFTPCSKETAAKHAPSKPYQLPSAVRALVPAALLAPPTTEFDVADEYEGDEGRMD